MEILQAKKGCLYIICHLYRPGAITFVTELEHEYYTPETPMADLFSLFNITYEGGLHFVIEIPSSKKSYDQVESLAKLHNLKLVNGKPYNGAQEFPVNCLPDACFVLENIEQVEFTQESLNKALEKARRYK
jgi:hypothetical protein